MNKRNLLPFIIIGCILMTPLGCSQQTTSHLITVDVMDCTGRSPVKTTVQLPQTQWDAMQADIASIRAQHFNAKAAVAAEIKILQANHLIKNTVSVDALAQRLQRSPLSQRPSRLALLNGTNVNAMCAIFFTLKNGSTVVLGLNTFINFIGFDIISFHQGNATGGIQTSGVTSKTTPPGPYVGMMFGFLGYWYGDRTGVGTYGNLTCAGFTVITAWVPFSAK